MGKGIEDISNFFISIQENTDSKPRVVASFQEPFSKRSPHWRVAVIGQTHGIPGFGWAAHLALAMSHCDQRVLLVDIGSDVEDLTRYLQPLKVYPSLNSLLDQSDKAIARDSTGGYRILSFQLDSDEIGQFKPEEREILFQILCREEQHSDILLANIHFDVMKTDPLSHLGFFHEVVLIVPSENIQETYGVLKALYHLEPDLRIGLIDTQDRPKNHPSGAQRLVSAASQFLKKTPVFLGGFPHALMDSEFRAFKLPPHVYGRDKFKKEFTELGQTILNGLNGPKDGRLLFETIESKFNSSPRSSERG